MGEPETHSAPKEATPEQGAPKANRNTVLLLAALAPADPRTVAAVLKDGKGDTPARQRVLAVLAALGLATPQAAK